MHCVVNPVTVQIKAKWSSVALNIKENTKKETILQGASESSQTLKEMDLNSKERTVVGREKVRVDVAPKVEGKALFTDDMNFPGMLYGMLKRSSLAHGKILKIDTEKARQQEGILAVITGADLPHKFGILPVTQDETALALDKVRYSGEPVAAVCALDELTAQQALSLIEVDYEALPVITSMEDANSTTERIHESPRFKGNAHRVISLEFGNTAEGFEKSDLVQEDLFFYSGNTHLPAEPHSTIAVYQNGRITLYTSHQAPYYLNQILPRVLDIPPENLRIVVPYVGGGFGGKLDPFPEIICAAKLAMITGRPVKFTLSREEVFYNHRGRHPSMLSIKTGVKAGKIQTVTIDSYIDGGAYGSFGVACSYYHGALETTTYILPSYKAQAVRYYTNKAPCGPKRGHGTPQPRFALECQLDKIAEKIGQDPIEFRLQNLIEPYSLTANHMRVTSCALKECIEKVRDGSDFSNKWKKLPYGEGVGFGLGCYLSGAALPIYWNDLPHSEVMIKADRTGTVSVFSGHTEIGQGSDTVLAYITAEVLGMRPEQIKLVLRDSDAVPPDMGSYSSRVTMMMGNAAKTAAMKLRDAIFEGMAHEWGVPIKSIFIENGEVKTNLDPEKVMALSKAIYRAEAYRAAPLVFSGGYLPDVPVGNYKGSGVGPSPAYSFSACVIHTKVDTTTGLVVPQKIWMAHDIGRCINESAVLGQVEGGIHMGLCEVLSEETKYNKQGLQQGLNLLDYKMLGPLDMPEIETYLVESEDPEGPFGAKEVGQGPLLPIIPALANAVYDAIGIRFDEIPITPPKVLKALDRKLDRVGPKGPIQFTFPAPIQVEGGGYVSIK